MIRLRSCILSSFLSSPATYLGLSLHRPLSAAAPAVSPTASFTVEDYLVDTCGLARAKALKASPKLSHLKSPTNPDAILAFLAGLGLSTADVAALVAKDPRFLCASVDRTLAPKVVGLTGLGLSNTEIARIVSIAPSKFRTRLVVSRLQYYLPLFGSFENLIRALKFNNNLLICSLERVVKPNIAILQECGLGACDIAKLCLRVPRILTSDSECLRAMVACAEGIGVPRGSVMFRHALHAVAFYSEEKIAAKVEFLKKTCRWSDAEVKIAVSKFPGVLRCSEDKLQRVSEFLISEVGLVPAYTAHRPAMLAYSLEGKLRPRYYVMKFLKANGFLDRDWNYYSAVAKTEKVFLEKYICPHKEAAPHLTEDYAEACRGQVPTRFRFQ
jgi:mTERF domain-containing protein